mmetsp:Transcript_76808/g.248897  ORF Transcript_76808/g.248897 Transcript_76808/m.248897 type:complete len:213 (-) Transcript_76808:811-1449(-)
MTVWSASHRSLRCARSSKSLGIQASRHQANAPLLVAFALVREASLHSQQPLGVLGAVWHHTAAHATTPRCLHASVQYPSSSPWRRLHTLLLDVLILELQLLLLCGASHHYAVKCTTFSMSSRCSRFLGSRSADCRLSLAPSLAARSRGYPRTYSGRWCRSALNYTHGERGHRTHQELVLHLARSRGCELFSLAPGSGGSSRALSLSSPFPIG